MNNNMEKEIFDIYIDDIIPNRFQPRLLFDEKSLSELADSIKQHGIIQPLVVRKVGDKYEIIAGERRYKASQIAGLQKVPAVVMSLDDKQSAEVAVIENIQRRDLTALEEAESYKKLLDKGYLTQEQLATRMGKAQATISNKLRLLGLSDEVKEALLNGKISERHARSLLSLDTQAKQKEALDKIINNKLTVRQTDELIKSMVSPSETIESIETLDFTNSPSNLPPTPIPFIATSPVLVQTPIEPSLTPVIEPLKEQSPMPNIPFIDETPTNFDPISNIDINQIKESAVDINPVDQMADVDALLGVKTVPEAPTVPVSIPVNNVDIPRFIPSFEDEETNMNMQEPKIDIDFKLEEPISTPPTPVQDTIYSSEPKLNADNINNNSNIKNTVQEFRPINESAIDTSKIVPGNLRSAINIVREITEAIEKNDFKVDVEEFDFEHLYQIIIKINK